MIDVNRECFEKERVRVLWPLSPGQGEVEKRKLSHAAGGAQGLSYSLRRIDVAVACEARGVCVCVGGAR